MAHRQKFPVETRATFARRIAVEGLRLVAEHRPDVISAFYPIRAEPDTLPLIAALADAGYVTALPVTVGRGEPLAFRAWKLGDATLPGGLKIPEPLATAPVVSPQMLFVPLAAFDRRGHRIGFGAGHYDRTLEKLRARREIIAVGVAFSTSEIAQTPAEAHDQPLDFILTELELIDARGAPR